MNFLIVHPISITFWNHIAFLLVILIALGLKLLIYWRPLSDNFTSVDAIICTAKAIILLQATNPV
jgi:hypothetical protein